MVWVPLCLWRYPVIQKVEVVLVLENKSILAMDRCIIFYITDCRCQRFQLPNESYTFVDRLKNNSKWISAAAKCWNLYKVDEDEFCNRLIPMDECWVYPYQETVQFTIAREDQIPASVEPFWTWSSTKMGCPISLIEKCMILQRNLSRNRFMIVYS